MSQKTVMITLLALIVLNMGGCKSPERSHSAETKVQTPSFLESDATEPESQKEMFVGMPNPAAVYCIAMGYEHKIVPDEDGNEVGFCIFPDDTYCLAWEFYRGKSHHKWSYAEKNGFDTKELGPGEGWFKGSVCIDRKTRKKIGNVYEKVVKPHLKKQGYRGTKEVQE